MSSNASTNASVLPPAHSSTDGPGLDISCLLVQPSSSILAACLTASVLVLLPLCTVVLCHGLQQRRRRRRALSHADSFTFHMVAIELLGVLGGVVLCCAIARRSRDAVVASLMLFVFTWHGQIFFHMLTCVERYLAVVRPLTYRGLRLERGVRIRNVSISAVWLLSAVRTAAPMEQVTFVFDVLTLTSVLAVVAFCGLSILRVLIRPGPGERGGARQRADQSKQRALYTVVAITGVLVIRFAWNLVYMLLLVFDVTLPCSIQMSNSWFIVPSSLVLPLLYLHRYGKLLCCANANAG